MKIIWNDRPAIIDGDYVYYLDGEMELVENLEDVFEAFADEISEEKSEFWSMATYDRSKGN